MTATEALALLEQKGDAKVRAMNAKNGAPDNQFGVKMGDIRAIAQSIKIDHELALQLWQTGNVEAMFLATLVCRPKQLSEEEINTMLAALTYTYLADWLTTNVIKKHPNKEALRQQWMTSEHPMLARAGWSLTAERISKQPEGIAMEALLDRIEREMGSAPAPTQWTMNYCLAEIGIQFPDLRQRAIDIGERLGIYRDYPVSKGCTSPFAPIWIREMVSRTA